MEPGSSSFQSHSLAQGKRQQLHMRESMQNQPHLRRMNTDDVLLHDSVLQTQQSRLHYLVWIAFASIIVVVTIRHAV